MLRFSRHDLVLPLTCVAIFAAGCFGGSGSSTSPTPSVASGSPLPTATSTPPPADPTLAAELRYRGEYETAAAVYAQVAAASDGDERQAARVEQASLLLQASLPAEAQLPLDEYALEAGASFDGSTAQFMLASVLDDLGEDAPSLDHYSRYVLAGGILSSYANIERAKLLATLARGPEAEAIATVVLADPAVADRVPSFVFSMGRAYASAGLDADAVRWYALVESNGGDVAGALFAIGDAKQRLGDATWPDDYLRAIGSYPASSGATEMLAALDAAAVPVTDYVRGVIHYRAFENDLARAALEAAAAVGDNPGEALYYLGALDERADADDGAVVRYEQSYASNPVSTLADSALWWRGRLLENASRYDEASLVYMQLAVEHPSSDWAEGARFRRGLVAYKAGLFLEAAEIWDEYGAAEGMEGFRARFWRGMALERYQEGLGATALEELAEDPDARGDYYAIRAAEVLGLDDAVYDDSVDIDDFDPDWEAISDSLTPQAAAEATAIPSTPTPTSTPVELNTDPRWALVNALNAVHLDGIANELRSEIITDAADDQAALLAVTRRFYDEANESYAARAAATLLSVLDADLDPHADLARIAYPPAYYEMVTEAAEENDIEPLLLFALMRQESLYDRDAGSVAGALGLMQIIPTTGEAIAAELEVAPYQTADLFRPAVSLRFGAHYLAAQIDTFDGELRHAVAAYNGGPGASLDARALSEEDIDLFVEDLEFDETNLYVRRVFEHWWWYRQLYDN